MSKPPMYKELHDAIHQARDLLKQNNDRSSERYFILNPPEIVAIGELMLFALENTKAAEE